jgi:hypothetical protein
MSNLITNSDGRQGQKLLFALRQDAEMELIANSGLAR